MSGGDGVHGCWASTISARSVHNPLLLMWMLGRRMVADASGASRFSSGGPAAEAFWRGVQALMITVATFAVLCLPLIVQAFRLASSGRYVSQSISGAARRAA